MFMKFLMLLRGGNNLGRCDFVMIGGCGGVVLDEVGERVVVFGGVVVCGWCDVMVIVVMVVVVIIIMVVIVVMF